MRSLDTNHEADIRVVGEIGSQGAMHTYGVAFVDPEIGFWQIEFPPAPQYEDRSPIISVACSGCGKGIELMYGDYQADVCAIHGGLVRYCADCGLSTLWRRCAAIAHFAAPTIASAPAKKPVREDPAVAVIEPPEIEPVLPVATPPREESFANWRDRVRAKVIFSLRCVPMLSVKISCTVSTCPAAG